MHILSDVAQFADIKCGSTKSFAAFRSSRRLDAIGAHGRSRRLRAATERYALCSVVFLTVLVLGCQTSTPPLPASPYAPTGTPTPVLSVSRASCASPVPATFTGRGAEIGYIGYRTCRGTVRNSGGASASVDVWVDALDAEGRPRGACRRPLGTIGPGTDREWEATCPVTAAEVGFSVRLSDPSGTPLPTKTP